MMTVEVPEAEYAVFTTPPVDLTKTISELYQNNPLIEMVQSSWRYIFEEWFPSSGYVYDDSLLDFEFYDEHCHYRPDTCMDIYVPVKKNDSAPKLNPFLIFFSENMIWYETPLS